MKIRAVNKEEFKTTNWSAGQTTELFIYPEGSSYAERRFLLRISSADVKEDYSIFTNLEGVERWLMVLEGIIELKHNDGKTIVLKPYETDRFSGEWKTESFGLCRDFNLMVKGNTEGLLECIKADTNKKLIKIEKDSITVLYCYEGRALAICEGFEHYTDRERLLVFEMGNEEEEIVLYSDRPVNIIKISVKLQTALH